ncbi:MAG: nucleoside-diphosphate sugar epimerase/dehydratase [Candidatus Firestonebacteria bacterium]
MDIVFINISLLLAFIIRFEGIREYNEHLLLIFSFATLARLTALFSFKIYNIIWKYSGMKDMLSLTGAITISSAIFVSAVFFNRNLSFPRAVILIDWLLCISFLLGYRIFPAIRPHLYFLRQMKKGKRTLIIGAGEAGTLLARDILRNAASGYALVGFIDDDKHKLRSTINGVEVLGNSDELEQLAKELKIEQIIITIPSASPAVIKKLVEICARLANFGIHYKIIPGYKEIIDGDVSISHIREVELEDLLGREAVTLDTKEISDYIKGNCVLITGAGGSIGSELTRQTLRFSPKTVILVGQGENSIYNMELELNKFHPNKKPAKIIPVIADIKEPNKMEYIFKKYSPNVVFHAAAYKHVPLMEHNPEEAIKNNIAGTKNMAELSVKYGVDRFVMVSTDKAVNPTSIMGATKKVAELVVQALSKNQNTTKFMTVRFGNVLGSRGSVIPLFTRQIKTGGPVTVTHPGVVRYFMTIEEAAQLVVQAGSMGKNGDVFVLDMGKPVKIEHLARDLIRLSGYTPDVDIHIKYVGLRPGEKLYEETLTAEEGISSSSHKKIFIARPEVIDQNIFNKNLKKLLSVADSKDFERQPAEALLKIIVPSFKPKGKRK